MKKTICNCLYISSAALLLASAILSWINDNRALAILVPLGFGLVGWCLIEDFRDGVLKMRGNSSAQRTEKDGASYWIPTLFSFLMFYAFLAFFVIKGVSDLVSDGG